MITPPRWTIPWISRTHVVLYKLTNGRIGGRLAGKPGILVRTIGAKSGKVHTICLPYIPVGEHRVIVASFAGGPRNPAWYHNLRANPDVLVREGARVFHANASVVPDDERPTVWQTVVADSPWYGDYQARTARQIPLIRLQETGAYVA
ncbi:MAG TPA: nitroreductase family deazaflavin-dependent oxidoreductase [Acidimicrobiales bacterium]|jgi:deazaflavin-dependent oxidoreductase (nitroreductase family)|nr:nitroreductase family deazaflavin-dependent oxidoreductase [Acidimicrobiales bacterium]